MRLMIFRASALGVADSWPGNFQDVSMAAGGSARASKRVCWVLQNHQGTCWTAMVHMHGPVCLQALHKDTMPMAHMYSRFWSLNSSQSPVLFLSGDMGAWTPAYKAARSCRPVWCSPQTGIGIHDGRTDIWALWKQRVRLCTGGEL